MKKDLQTLYEEKIKIYERILNEIKVIDMELIIEFENEFNKIDELSDKINALKPDILKEKIMTMQL